MKIKNMLLVGCAVVGLGCYMKTNINQIVNEDIEINEESISLENVIKEIKMVNELVLSRENGIGSIEHHTCKEKWNCWLVDTETVVEIDYELLLGIDMNDVEMFQSENKIIVIAPKDFDILALEVNDEVINSKYHFLSKYLSDDKQIELKELLIDDIKNKGITEESKIECMKSFEKYVRNLENTFDVNIEIY